MFKFSHVKVFLKPAPEYNLNALQVLLYIIFKKGANYSKEETF